MKTAPPSAGGLEKLALDRLDDAKALFASGRYDGSVYLCGYCIELALKARICKHLSWAIFPSDIPGVRTHSLDTLLRFTGLVEQKESFGSDWDILSKWSPEMRYDDEASFKETDAFEQIRSTEELLKVFL